MRITTTLPTLSAGDMLALHGPAAPAGLLAPSAEIPWDALPRLRAGLLLDVEGAPLLRVSGALRWPGEAPAAVVMARVLRDAGAGEAVLETRADGLSLAWITLSDKGAAGLREDRSGPVIEEEARSVLSLSLARGYLIPDDAAMLRALLTDLALTQGFDLILTSGGTGVGPRDVTPEATLAVIDKRLPGFEQAMTAASLQKTPHGAISRAVAGTLGQAIIVNLPGSPKAVRENLQAVLPALRHASEKLKGDQSDCATA